MNGEIHAILGAGQIGKALARELARRGAKVRMAARSPIAAIEGVEALRGDLADPAFASRVADGARVVYNCTNPPYPAWNEELPPLVSSAIAAARSAGAHLVALDNLYAFGRMGGAAMTPDGPFEPCSRKGALRKRLAEEMLAAPGVVVSVARASDFVGPGVVNAHLGERFFQRSFAGKAGECFGDPTLPHAFTYGPDVAVGLATLGASAPERSRIWHLPTLPARSMDDWARALGAELGRDVRVSRVPGWAVAVMGVFSPMIRELAEMRYQWEEPYLVDDSAFRAAFGVEPTPFEEQVRATAAWARATYDARAAA